MISTLGSGKTSMTGTKVFVDTNILVYAWDGSEPQKQKKALLVLEQLVAHGSGVISTQRSSIAKILM